MVIMLPMHGAETGTTLGNKIGDKRIMHGMIDRAVYVNIVYSIYLHTVSRLSDGNNRDVLPLCDAAGQIAGGGPSGAYASATRRSAVQRGSASAWVEATVKTVAAITRAVAADTTPEADATPVKGSVSDDVAL
jgi:hypothetical protein